MNGLALVARRELRAQVRTRGFAIGLVVSGLLIAAAIVVPPLLADDGRHRVGLAGTGADALAPVLAEIARGAGLTVDTVVDDEPAVRAGVTAGDLDAAVIASRTIVADGTPDDELAVVLQQAHASVTSRQRLLAAGLDQQQLRQATDIAPLQVVSLTGDATHDGARQALAFLTVLILFFLIIGSAMQVAMGVVEEKSSRIVEILLVAVRPWQLLGGKIVAFALLGLIQLVVFAAVGVGTAAVTSGLPRLPPGTAEVVATAFVGFLLGFVFYGALAAALASLVSRQEEVGQVLTPLTMVIMASYLVGVWATREPDATVSQVVSMTPPFAAMVMPVRVAAGDVGPVEVAVAVLGMAAATAVVLAAGGRIYQRAVLRTGSRVRFREAWRSPTAASD